MSDSTQTADEPFASWAIVEIMGHRKLAGFVTEQLVAGVRQLRIDVPAQEERDHPYYAERLPATPAFTQYYGGQSLFSLTPCTEAAARAALARMTLDPPAQLALPAPADGADAEGLADGAEDLVDDPASRLCPHGELPHDCNDCMVHSDLAYDAWRERVE